MEVARFTVIVHGPVPLHPAPTQPVNVELASGLAVRVTTVPMAKIGAHADPQSRPAGALVTVPCPAPPRPTVTTADGAANVAVTDAVAVAVPASAAVTVTVQGPVPLHPPPLHPLNVDPAAGLAVKVTWVPEP